MLRRWVFAAVAAAGLLGDARADDSPWPAPPPPPVAAAAPGLFDVLPSPPPPPPPTWCGGVEFGLNGATGNAETFKLRVAANAKQATADHVFTVDTLLNYATADSAVVENRWLSNARYEWLFGPSPWSVYVDGQLELNQFRAYDARLANHVGFGYRFFKTDTCCLKGRLGVGTSREFGGPTDDWVPEGQLGFDAECRVSERGKFVGSFDYYPDLSDFGLFRSVGKVAYEHLIDLDWNVTLKVGAQDIYDNHSRGQKFNDLDYFAAILWKF